MSGSPVRKKAVPGMTFTEELRIIRTKFGTDTASLPTRVRTSCVPRHQAHITRPTTAATATGT